MAILVAGGTGNVGSAVVRSLSACGVSTKVITRDPSAEKAQRLAGLPGVSIVKGDICDANAMAVAFQGVTAAFLGCSNSESQVAAEKSFIDAAVTASSCTYLVKLGTCGAEGYTGSKSLIQYGQYHAEIEDHLGSSSLKWTVLRPNEFMQNHMGDIFGTLPLGIVAYPLHPNSMATIVDTRDVGDMAAKLLQLDGADRAKHEGQKYNVCGPKCVSTRVLAKLYSAALGRPIRAVQIPTEEWATNAEKAGFPAWLAQAVSKNFADFWDKGMLNYSSSEEVLALCAPQRTMQAWIQEHAPMSPSPVLTKPVFHQVANLEPDQTGVNLKVKVAKSVAAGEADGQQKEVVVGDENGVVTLRLRDDHVATCSIGASLRIQNAKCVMVKGHMRLVVDKWGVLKPAAEALDFEPNTGKDMSAVEYELA